MSFCVLCYPKFHAKIQNFYVFPIYLIYYSFISRKISKFAMELYLDVPFCSNKKP